MCINLTLLLFIQICSFSKFTQSEQHDTEIYKGYDQVLSIKYILVNKRIKTGSKNQVTWNE